LGAELTCPHGREIVQRVKRKFRVYARIDGMAARDEQQRVAVRRRLGGGLAADDAVRTRPVVDDHLLAERFDELLGEEARLYVGVAARCERDDQADGLGRVLLGVQPTRA
jgi:hypothetical protein